MGPMQLVTCAKGRWSRNQYHAILVVWLYDMERVAAGPGGLIFPCAPKLAEDWRVDAGKMREGGEHGCSFEAFRFH